MEDRIKQFLKTIKLNESVLSLFFGIVTVILVGILVFRIYNANKPEITQQAEETAAPSATAKVGEVAVEVKEDGSKVPVSLPETYKVESGDHLWKIAEKQYGSGYNWVDIAKENNLKAPYYLSAGQELKMPKVAVREAVKPTVAESSKPEQKPADAIQGENYTVAKGDHLWGIAVRAYGDGYKWTEIAKANNIATPNYIEVGQKLELPR